MTDKPTPPASDDQPETGQDETAGPRKPAAPHPPRRARKWLQTAADLLSPYPAKD